MTDLHASNASCLPSRPSRLRLDIFTIFTPYLPSIPPTTTLHIHLDAQNAHQFYSHHFKELYNQFRAVHKAIQSVNPVVKDPVPEIIAKLDKYEPEAQIIIVTHLVFIYSQWDPEATKTSHDGDRCLTRESAYRSMYVVRCVMQALDKKGISVRLNPWNQHLLMHFEDLAPCPMHIKEEKDILDKMWGDDWEETFATDVRNKYDNFLPLADHCRKFNMTRDDVYNMIVEIQPNVGSAPVTNATINETVRHVNQLGRTLGNWVKSKKGGAAVESAPLVETISWPRTRYGGSQYISEPQRPLFLDAAAPELANAWPSFEEMFFPSGKTKIAPEEVLAHRKKLTKYSISTQNELMDEMDQAFRDPLQMMLMMAAMAGGLGGGLGGSSSRASVPNKPRAPRKKKEPVASTSAGSSAAVESNKENTAAAAAVGKGKGKAAAPAKALAVPSVLAKPAGSSQPSVHEMLMAGQKRGAEDAAGAAKKAKY